MRKINLLYLLIVVGLWGCYPDKIETIDDLTLVYTSYNENYDFEAKKTVYVPDSIAFDSNVELDSLDSDKLEEYQEKILQEVSRNFENQGYTVIDSAEAAINPPDMIALVGGIASLNSGAVWIPGPGYWWWGYPPSWGWYPGWGWYYPPGWGGYYTYYSYATGTISIFLADFESAGIEDSNTIELEWNAVINGLLSGVVSDDKIEKNISQAFKQSPYLTNK